MCGIFGSYSFGSDRMEAGVLERMAKTIHHRGPDAMGYHNSDQAALGNTRLSILDLGHSSDQPIYSDDKQIVVVQNGEIYNYIELREELKNLGAQFKTTGDTEVLLHAFQHWGPHFVTRLNGMFAISIFDQTKNTMWIYRDRLGVKPLYMAGGPDQGRMWFASEIKTILDAGVVAKPNYDALAQFLALNYIPQPHTAFEGIVHLPPATVAQITPNGMTLLSYWDLLDTKPDTAMSPVEAQEELVNLLDDATRIRMRSDAQFGAFLSGGLDSTSVVAMMTRHQKSAVRTFSIGFTDKRFDESEWAQMAADRLGTDHTGQIIEHEAASLWHHFIHHVDQPHGDVSFIPMGQVSKLAAKDVKMVLTGDGGDELFAGYEKYLGVFKNGSTDHLQAGWDADFVRQSGLLLGDEPDRLLQGSLRSAFFDQDPYRALMQKITEADHQDPINQVLYAETTTLLSGNNLVKPDRMAMAHSLEVRSPFLDYRMAEFAFRVPGAYKLRDGVTKAVFKDAVESILGTELTHRKKQMFTVPIGEWFREKLEGFCRDILFDGRFASRGLVDTTVAEQMLNQHVDGSANYTRQIRAMISLEIWFRIFIDRDEESLAKV